MKLKDYYKILGLETSRVSIEQIKAAYRNAAKKYHPDVNMKDSLAEEKIKDINEAYRILSVPSSKRKYDRSWNAYYAQKTRNSLKSKESIFGIFLGDVEKTSNKDEKNSPIRGEDVETEIKIELNEAFTGTEKKISIKTVQGKTKTFTINIPKGILNGEKIRLIGQGKQGINGGKDGDMYIKINIQDSKKFKLKGSDLHTYLLLTPWEAGLGARVVLQTIDDETKIYIPQGIQSGEILRIPNKGYWDGQENRGDLIAEVKIVVPKTMQEQEKKLYEQMQKISTFNPREEY